MPVKPHIVPLPGGQYKVHDSLDDARQVRILDRCFGWYSRGLTCKTREFAFVVAKQIWKNRVRAATRIEWRRCNAR